MSMRCSLLWCFVTILHQASCIESYYWRLYNGTVPDDAFAAGKDIHGKNVFVGQVYMADGGLVPGQLYEGVNAIEVSWGTAVKKDKYINILCGSQENFKWLRTDSAHLHLDLLGKRPVIGGWYEGFGYYYVSRIFTNGQTIVGKIHQFEHKDPIMDFVLKHKWESTRSYEVLYYDENDLGSDVFKNQQASPLYTLLTNLT